MALFGSVTGTGSSSRAQQSLVLGSFATALFLSAYLLFSVQPMFTKMVLPILGGAPGVWSVAMVFFQALLLAGYTYAHLLTRFVPIGVATIIHLTLMAVAFLAMPIAVAAGWGRPPAEGEAFWLLGLFTMSVGLPFFAIAGNGPLLQAWFSRTGHPQASDPYFLYGASNIGSFAALLAYPFLVEPFLPLKGQSQMWTQGFVLLAGAIAICGLIAIRATGATATAVAASQAQPEAAPTWIRRLTWIGLALVPSGLLVGVTAHISTDVAAVPLLWVVPLALYLLTFILAFRDGEDFQKPIYARIQIWGTAALLLNMLVGPTMFTVSLALHLGMFFLNALLCHAALYRLRPSAGHLTEFYLFVSLGGVIGGILTSLIAPNVFSSVIEYPWLVVAALFCGPAFLAGADKAWWLRAGKLALAAFVFMLLAAALSLRASVIESTALWIMVALVVMMMLFWRDRAATAALGVVAALYATNIQNFGLKRETFRSFFGVHKIALSNDGRFRTLSHGTTIHGAIRVLENDGQPATGRPEPTTYYTFQGAIGDAIESTRQARGGKLARVSAIGLGTGSLACHVQPGEGWTFFEIDPVVLELARDQSRFRFLSECAPDAPVVLGDARLTIGDQAGGQSLIVVDAFSSDAIPLHLLTREALGLYLSKLDERGVLVMHISNRHLDLARILARTAAEHGLIAYRRSDDSSEPFDLRYKAPAIVMAFARAPEHLGAMATSSEWRRSQWKRIESDPALKPWTDDYSNLLLPLLDKKRGLHN
jgi:hypothetical protein